MKPQAPFLVRGRLGARRHHDQVRSVELDVPVQDAPGQRSGGRPVEQPEERPVVHDAVAQLEPAVGVKPPADPRSGMEFVDGGLDLADHVRRQGPLDHQVSVVLEEGTLLVAEFDVACGWSVHGAYRSS